MYLRVNWRCICRGGQLQSSAEKTWMIICWRHYMLSAFWRICDLANVMPLRNHNHGISHVSFNDYFIYIYSYLIYNRTVMWLWHRTTYVLFEWFFHNIMLWLFFKDLYIVRIRSIYHHNYYFYWSKVARYYLLYHGFLTKFEFLKENDLFCYYNLFSRPNMIFWDWSNRSPWFSDKDKILMSTVFPIRQKNPQPWPPLLSGTGGIVAIWTSQTQVTPTQKKMRN